MCRYAFKGPYKRHYACFDCRKAFKRNNLNSREAELAEIVVCPDCKSPMNNMGLDFKAPKNTAIEHWAVVAYLFRRGFSYHSCGCGPGFRPTRWSEVPRFLKSHHCQSPGEILAAQFDARLHRARRSMSV